MKKGISFYAWSIAKLAAFILVAITAYRLIINGHLETGLLVTAILAAAALFDYYKKSEKND